jgi:magnesium transporter
MAEEQANTGGKDDAAPTVREADGTLAAEFVDTVTEAVEEGDKPKVAALVADLHTADVADLIEALDPDDRVGFVEGLGDAFDYAALAEVDEGIRDQLLEELPTQAVAEGVAELDSDDAVYILEGLDDADRQEILEQMPAGERVALKRNLDYPEESAGRRMQSTFIAVPQFWTVGQAIDHMREASDLPDEFHEVFIVDPTFRLLGVVQLNRLLRAKRPTPLIELMDETGQVVHATEDQEEVARKFERYDLVSAAVVDDAERLVGVLTIDDMLDVITEETDEDIRRLVGLGDEELTASVFRSSRSRLPWLMINSVTAFLAAAVIGLFGGSIEQMVALAVLMPIVATLGGSTGVQAMTVTVRALATRDLGRGNARRIILREMLVGLVNGIALAVLVGAAAGFWFSNVDLGVVIGLALVINMLVAGIAGVMVPITLNRLNLDPAVSSGVFVSTVTDVVGFFAFLGLAAAWFGLL